MGVDRAAAHQPLVELELAQRGEQLGRGSDDLGADPVAGEDDYAGDVAHRVRHSSQAATASMLSRT